VQGQFDAVPALFSLLALWFALKSAPAAAGAALAAAVLLKVYAVILAPVVLLTVWAGASAFPERTRRLARLAGGGIAVTVIGAAGLLSPYARTQVTSRTETTLVGGGINLWFPTYVQSALPWFQANAGMLSRALLICDAVVSLSIVALLFRSRGEPRRVAPLASCALISGGLLAGPITNPQYLVWLLPFAIWLAARREIPWALIWVLSAAGVLFQLGTLGFTWPALILPAGVFLHWTWVVPAVLQGISTTRMAPGMLNDAVYRDWLFASSTLGVAALMAILVATVWRLAKASR
jgi:hypothetical protein